MSVNMMVKQKSAGPVMNKYVQNVHMNALASVASANGAGWHNIMKLKDRFVQHVTLNGTKLFSLIVIQVRNKLIFFKKENE